MLLYIYIHIPCYWTSYTTLLLVEIDNKLDIAQDFLLCIVYLKLYFDQLQSFALVPSWT